MQRPEQTNAQALRIINQITVRVFGGRDGLFFYSFIMIVAIINII